MAFKGVFMTYYVPLCNYANNILHDDTIAEDVVQDVFLHLWNSNETHDIKGSMQSMLFSSVKNKAYEHLRSRKAYNKALNNINVKTVSNAILIEKESHEYMAKERINELLRHLPPKCKNVFALHRLNGLTYAEIAESEGISEKTVQNHMIKALKILRIEYAKTLNIES